MAINITQKNSTTNTTYLANRSLLYIVWHYTAGVTSKKGAALDTASWFANSAAQASADFIVDDYYIVQFNKDIKNRYCWAVGGGNYGNKGGRLYGKATNKNCISIEICSNNSSGRITYPNDPRYSVTEAALNNALQLTWYLMDLYGIDANHVIRHYDVNGKPCIGVIGWNAESNSETEWVKWHNKIATKKGTVIDTSPVASTDRYFVASAYTGGKYINQHNTFNILENAKNDCDAAMKVSNKTFYVYDTQSNNKVVYTAKYDPTQKHTQTSELKNLSDKDAADVLLEIVKPIALAKNLFPSVIAAQCILESGFGHKTELSGYNNICGMKCDLLNSQWSGSAWDGKSRARIYTPEEYTKGQITYIWAYFRAYHCIEDCITDICAFLSTLPKYVNAGVMNAKNYKEQITIESKCGYATDSSYISKVCDIITRYELDRYDSQKKSYVAPSQPSTPLTPTATSKTPYRVATSYSDGKYVGQIDAYNVLDNAKKRASEASQSAKKTYYVYDNTGVVVYTAEYKTSSTTSGKITKVSEWISVLKNYGQKMIDVKAVYSNSGNKTDYEVALKQKPVTQNCALYLTHSLAIAGLFTRKDKFYGASGGSLKGSGVTTLTTKIGKIAAEYPKGKMKTDNLTLIPGDIVTYYGQHTNVYIGTENGKKVWYDFGRGTTIACKEGSTWKSFKRTGEIGGMYVAKVIRLNLTDDVSKKETATTKPSTSTPKKLYDVKVTITDLRIRETPNGTIKGYIKPGVYGITEEMTVNGIKWGHLLSSVGWIALDYVTRL